VEIQKVIRKSRGRPMKINKSESVNSFSISSIFGPPEALVDRLGFTLIEDSFLDPCNVCFYERQRYPSVSQLLVTVPPLCIDRKAHKTPALHREQNEV
jgi:hypothetical protein